MDATFCGFEAEDVIFPTNVDNCIGRKRCFISLQDQVNQQLVCTLVNLSSVANFQLTIDKHYTQLRRHPDDGSVVYLQVNYGCVDSSPSKPDLIPSLSHSLRDYMIGDDHVGISQKGLQAAVAEGKFQCQLLTGICSLRDYMKGKNRAQIDQNG